MTLLADGRPLLHYESAISGDSLVLADGTVWSHAATLGTRFKGDAFTIDRATVENFVRVFTSGYPRKVPVDYEHASTTDDPEVRKLRAQGKVPKAGDVVELRGVFAPADFVGDLQAAAEKLSAQAGRALDDPRNLGLWMRWKPTARALAAVKAGEYTELSIAFESDLPHNVDGAGQGPGLWAVALLNTPFLDDMLPVAASRDSGRSPAVPGSHEGNMQKLTVLSVAAAVLGKAITSEDDALTELSALAPQLRELAATREFQQIVGAEFENEKDPAKVATKVRELRAAVQAATDAAAQQKKDTATQVATTTIAQFERQIANVPLRDKLTRDLTKELEAGTALEQTETLLVLKALAPDAKFVQASTGGTGAAAVDEGDKIDARAQELLRVDPTIKALYQQDGHTVAFRAAIRQAKKELAAAAR